VLNYASGGIVRSVPPKRGFLARLLIGPEAPVAETLATGPWIVKGMPTARLGWTVFGWTRMLLTGALGVAGISGATYVCAIAIGAAAMAIAALATAVVNLACGLMLLALAAVILSAIGGKR
jgi:hypothetical protein